MRKKITCLTLFILLLFSLASAQNNKVAITIYNQNLALVKDQRALELQKGINQIKFTDVASQIDPTSVHFKSLDYPEEVVILEQNYQYDLVSSEKILEKYVEEKIEIKAKEEKAYRGELLSFSSNNLTLREENGGVRIVSRAEILDLYFPSLPEGLITRPTLVWLLDSDVSGSNKTEVSYLTQGVNWHAEYVGVVGKDDKSLELSGWVSIDNKSGATYADAKIKLIAGEVHQVEEKIAIPQLALADVTAARREVAFEEKPFFEYHLYTLKRSSTLKDKEIKQITLFPSREVNVSKILVYDGARDSKSVKVNLEFINSEEQGLGLPLPKGKLRVYKEDVDKSLEFVGEDLIDHTPKDEKVRVYLGDAFDVVGERKRTDYKKISEDVWEESYQVKIRNHKEEKIEVTVVEHLYYYTEWEILETNLNYIKKDSHTIEFKLPVEKDGETVLNYAVRYVR